jgi:hypothetical protein
VRKSTIVFLIAALALLVAVPAGMATAKPPHKTTTQKAAQKAAKKAAKKAHPAKKKPKPKKAKAKAKKTATGAIVFAGTYSGQASTKVDGNNASISANGNGTGTGVGSGTITGSGTADASQQPCPPFGGTGTITGAKGTIQFSVASGAKGCGDDGGHVFSLVGYLTVTKATGAVANKKGQLRFTGTYNRDAGTFQIKLTGTLK